MTLPLSEYLRAIELARKMERTDGAVVEVASNPVETSYLLATALIQADSERRTLEDALVFAHQTNAALQAHMGKTRTPETVEACEVCRQLCIMFDDEGCAYVAEEGEDDYHCPLRRGNAE